MDALHLNIHEWKLKSGYRTCIQVINDEDGGILKKYGHAAIFDASSTHQFRHSTGLPILAAGHSPIPSGLPHSSNGNHTSSISGHNTNPVSRSASNILQRKSTEGAPERSLESVLQASQQQVNAIETILKGVAVEDRDSNQAQKAGICSSHPVNTPDLQSRRYNS